MSVTRTAGRLGLALLVGVLGLAALPQAAGATSPAWSIVSTTPPVALHATGVACPTRTTCFAADEAYDLVSLVKRSTDGGATWSLATTLSPGDQLDSMTCATTTACVAMANGGATTVVTTDGWATWHAHTVPESLTLYDVVCVSALDCSASGTDPYQDPEFLTSTDGGATWSVRAVPLDTDAYYQGIGFSAPLACRSRVSCDLLGMTYTTVPDGSLTKDVWYVTVFRTQNAGRSWTDVRLPHWLGNVDSLTCVAARCYAGGSTSEEADFGGEGALLASSDFGATWHALVRTRVLLEVGDVACATTADCVATADTPTFSVDTLTTTDGGARWSRHLLGKFGTGGGMLLCTSTTTCLMLGDPLLRSTNGGSTWSVVDAPTTAEEPIYDLSCPVAGTCEAASTVPLRTTDGGVTWTAQTVPPGVEYVRTMSCPTVSTCFAAAEGGFGGASQLLQTTDGGSTWTADKLPTGTQYVVAVACGSATTCVATTFDGVLYTSDGGLVWTKGTIPAIPSADFYELEDAACPSATTCYVTGAINTGIASIVATFLTTTDGGAKWSSTTLPGQGESNSTDLPGSIACSSSTQCVSVGYSQDPQGILSATGVAVFVTADGGSAWTQVHAVGAQIQGTSNGACTAGGWCETIGTDPNSGDAYALTSTDGGSTWSSAAMPATWLSSDAIACTGVGACLSAGTLTTGGLGIASLG